MVLLPVLIALYIGIYSLMVLAEIGDITGARRPKELSFDDMRQRELKRRNVIVPAMQGMVSGLIVSLSVSLMYGSLVGGEDEWMFWVGLVMFILGLIVLAGLLSRLHRDGVSRSLANNPFAIGAAASKYASEPQGSELSPDFLRDRLNRWKRVTARRSMNIWSDGESPRYLDAALAQDSAAKSKKWIYGPIRIYLAAIRAYPIRFIWPIVWSAVALIAWTVLGFHVIHGQDIVWYRLVLVTLVSYLVILAPATLYVILRGILARSWYRIYSQANIDASERLAAAVRVEQSVQEQNSARRRRDANLDAVLEHLEKCGSWNRHWMLKLGRAEFILVIRRG